MGERRVILEIKHLSKQFRIKSPNLFEPPKTLHALHDISLDVYEGETLGIIGESGCGKSTLGKCIVQLHKPSSGEILFEGVPISSLSGKALKEMRRNVQMIFQDPFSSLDPRQTAGSIIAEPLEIHNIEKSPAKRQEEALRLLREVGLDIQHLHRYPHEFSGGQRQRINVARALSLHPKLIVCDEPVSALDVSVQAQVLNLLNEVQERYGLTYLFISHDLSVIRHISDRIAVMYLGHLVELCQANEIYQNPLHPYTQALLSAVPPESPFEKKAEMPLHGEIPSPIGKREGCPLCDRCPHCTERCRREVPTLTEVAPGHQTACFLYSPQASEP